MRTSTAYFVGAGTVIAAIVVGLGGGLLMANIVSPHSPKNGTEVTRLEQRMSTRPIAVITGPSEPVPYLTATRPAATNPGVAAAPAENQPQQTQTEPANTTQAAAQPAEPAVAPAAQAPARAQAASPEAEDSSAKVRDVDMKRAGAEKRRADRRQQWAEKRRYQQRQEQELRDVEQKVREQTEPAQAFTAEPVKLDMRRIRLFDAE
jgi:hypothetical protein